MIRFDIRKIKNMAIFIAYPSLSAGCMLVNISSQIRINSSFFIPLRQASADTISSSDSSFSRQSPSPWPAGRTVAPFLLLISINPSVFSIWYVLFTVMVLIPASLAICRTEGSVSPARSSPLPIPLTIWFLSCTYMGVSLLISREMIIKSASSPWDISAWTLQQKSIICITYHNTDNTFLQVLLSYYIYLTFLSFSQIFRQSVLQYGS